MTRYAVGDLQGCLQPLQCLLDQVSFNPDQDQLWLVGDLINRGPQSLETLRFIKNLGNCTRVVLGNHDLHFIAIAYGSAQPGRSDTYDEILAAEDCNALCDWLRQQPLLYSDPSGDYHMSHAGIPPIWTIDRARAYAREVEAVLCSNDPKPFLQAMYGNEPATWDEQLQGLERLRVITNYFTRMRFCNAAGELDLVNKLDSTDRPGFAPWFEHSEHRCKDEQLIFGHWASLEGRISAKNCFGIDTGCVWGRKMSLLNLEDKTLSQCDC